MPRGPRRARRGERSSKKSDQTSPVPELGRDESGPGADRENSASSDERLAPLVRGDAIDIVTIALDFVQ
jgi:hypothetical protein